MTNQILPQRVQAQAVKSSMTQGITLREIVIHARFHVAKKSIVKHMKKKECPSCAMEIDAQAAVCPICKFEFPKRSPWITWVAIFLVIVWLLSYLL